MTNKELNSHDLARELEIVKLQEENERLNGAIQTYDILLKSNIKENEELKSILRGTTHCFDEEEHNKLKEENQKLKKQLENYKKLGFKHLQDKNNNLETQQKEFINYLESWKENEEYCYLASNPIDRCRKDIYKEVLQKYKEIIGDDK